VAWGSTCCCCGGVFESARARAARCRHGTSSVCCTTTPALSPSIHQEEEEEEGGAELRPSALVRTLGYTMPYGSPCANGSSSSPPPLDAQTERWKILLCPAESRRQQQARAAPRNQSLEACKQARDRSRTLEATLEYQDSLTAANTI
jgi:hypothetical protein